MNCPNINPAGRTIDIAAKILSFILDLIMLKDFFRKESRWILKALCYLLQPVPSGNYMILLCYEKESS
jgi:hypothetical protein